MDKELFCKNYQISDAVPINPASIIISADGLALAIEEYINDRFRGVAKVESSIYTGETVLVCPEYAAFFFKQLLSFIYGRVFINLKITTQKEMLHMDISCEDKFPLTDHEMRILIKTARNGGMEIMPGENSMKLTLRYADSRVRRIYAVSLRDGRRIMLSKMCEIFNCGAVYSTVMDYSESTDE